MVNFVSISLLRPHPKNSEYYSPPIQKEYDFLKRSIAAQGIRDPLKVLPDYTVIAGHLRLEIAKELGLEKVPVEVWDISPEEAEYLLVADNDERRTCNDPIKKAKRAEFLKRYWNVREGSANPKGTAVLRQDQNGLDGDKKTLIDVAKAIGESETNIKRLLKLNDLIPPLQELVSAGKLGQTAAYSLAFLPPEEQERLLAVLGKSGVCGLSVSEAQELRRELASLRREKESLLERLSDLQDSQKEAEELRAKLTELEARPIEKVVEKVVYKTDPALEAELEAARKQSAELLKRNEFLETRFADIAKEKEQKEAKLRQVETEKEMLERQCEHFKKELLKEKKKPKPDLDKITALNLMSQIVKSSIDLSAALKTLVNKCPDQVLAFARVRGGASLEDLGDVVEGAFSFKALEISLNNVIQKCMDFFGLLEQKPKLKVLRGGDSPDEGQKSAKKGD